MCYVFTKCWVLPMDFKVQDRVVEEVCRGRMKEYTRAEREKGERLI